MTDSRVSQAVLQVLTKSVPDARVSQGVLQALTTVIPTARVSQGVLQVMTNTVAPPVTAHYVRTAGSSRPLLYKQGDGTWVPVKVVGP